MTEILIDLAVNHPPDLVWRALTERAALAEWFMRTDLEPYQGHRFRFVPDGLLGLDGSFDGELVEVDEPRRLVMLWRGEQMHSKVTWELTPLPKGCRVRLSHTGFIGVKGGARRRELRRAYDTVVHERLPRVLDRLAAGDRPGPDPVLPPRADPVLPPPAPFPPVEPDLPPDPERPPPVDPDRLPEPAPVPAAGQPRRGRGRSSPVGPVAWLNALPHRRRGQILATAAAVLLAVLTTAVITSLGIPPFIPPLIGPDDEPVPPPVAATSSPGAPQPLPGTPDLLTQSGGPQRSAPGSRAPTRGPDAEPTTAPSPTVAPDAAPAERRWVGTYRTTESAASGFTGELTVTNAGPGPAGGWTVLVTVPNGATLDSVKGAQATQSGNTITFTPKNSGKVGPGASKTVDFEVSGASAPTGCRIDGQACG